MNCLQIVVIDSLEANTILPFSLTFAGSLFIPQDQGRSTAQWNLSPGPLKGKKKYKSFGNDTSYLPCLSKWNILKVRSDCIDDSGDIHYNP